MARFGRTQPHRPWLGRPPVFPPRSLVSSFSETATLSESFAKLTTPAVKSETFFVADGYQNLLLYSQDFTQTNWTKASGATITANYNIAPDGTQTGTKINGFSSAGGDRVTQTYNSGVNVKGNSYTFSVWVMAEGTDIGKSINLTVKRQAGTSS